jgi:hypothetical protein
VWDINCKLFLLYFQEGIRDNLLNYVLYKLNINNIIDHGWINWFITKWILIKVASLFRKITMGLEVFHQVTLREINHSNSCPPIAIALRFIVINRGQWLLGQIKQAFIRISHRDRISHIHRRRHNGKKTNPIKGLMISRWIVQLLIQHPMSSLERDSS